MDSGFAMLEKQDFKEAEKFFEEILNTHPESVTANICYGRALGLGGSAKIALQHLKKLYSTYPNNFEIGLNVAEAYMWNEQFSQALQLYKALYPSHPNDFVVNQGIANASASLHDNDTAFRFIKKALEIQPDNSGAKLSAKYIRLAKCEELHRQGDIEQAHLQLDTILLDFKNDREVLLKRAVIYLTTDELKKASETYTLLYTNKIDIYEGLAGMSYTSKLQHKNKKALSYAQQAFEYANATHKQDDEILIRAYIGIIDSYGINRNFKKSFSYLEEAEQLFQNTTSLDLTRARMHLWNRSYSKAFGVYNQMDDMDNSFEYHLGLAELYRATSDINKAKDKVKEGLHVIPNETNAVRFLKELKRMQKPTFTIGHFVSKDNGQNTAKESVIGVNLNNKSNITPNFYIKSRASTDIHQNRATQNIAGLRVTYKPHFRLNTKASAEVTTNTISESSKANNYTYHIGQDALLGKYHQIQFATTKYFYNYTSDLIQSNLGIQDYIGQYQYTKPKLPNLFVQYIHSRQSDDNTKNLIYSSLYYTIKAFPNIKAGINYLEMGFETNLAELYFSPESFSNVELFTQLDTKSIQKNKWHLILLGALGQQQINNEAPQTTMRAEITMGYQIDPSILIESKYTYNTSAHSTAVGFTHQKIGMQLHYVIPTK